MDLKQLSADLKKHRLNWDNHWQEVAERCLTDQADFNVKRSQGEKRNQRVFDSTASLAVNRSASAMQGLTMPKGEQYQKLITDSPDLNKDRQVQEYFEQVTRVLFSNRYAAGGRFSAASDEVFRSLMGFGTGLCSVMEDPSGRGINYQSMFLGAMYIGVDYLGMIDTVMREFELSYVQAVQQWGEENLPAVVNADKKDPYTMRTYQHFVYPNTNYVPGSLAPQERQFTYQYVCSDDFEKVIDEGGYFELPYGVVRTVNSPIEIYGRSPAMHVLPEIKGVNEMRKTNIKAAHIATMPPLLSASQGAMGVGGLGAGGFRINATPGGITQGGINAQGQPMVAPLLTGVRPDIGQASIEDSRRVINDAFFINLFQILVETPNMTATEVLARNQEKGMLLAPVGERIEEYMDVITQRELGILERQGLLPEVPGILIEAGGNYKLEYNTPIHRLRRSDELRAIDSLFARASQAAAYDPSAMDVIDIDAALRISAEIDGAPVTATRSQADVDEMRGMRAAQEQQQQMIAEAPAMAGAARDLAQAQALG